MDFACDYIKKYLYMKNSLLILLFMPVLALSAGAQTRGFASERLGDKNIEQIYNRDQNCVIYRIYADGEAVPDADEQKNIRIIPASQAPAFIRVNYGTTPLSGYYKVMADRTIEFYNTLPTSTEEISSSRKPVIHYSAAINQVSCSGYNDGSISLSAYESKGPYTYAWNTGDLIPSITNLSPGIYTCTITDALGNTRITDAFELVPPTPLEANKYTVHETIDRFVLDPAEEISGDQVSWFTADIFAGKGLSFPKSGVRGISLSYKVTDPLTGCPSGSIEVRTSGVKNSQGWYLYPNPASTMLYLRPLDTFTGDAVSISVIDNTGRKIYTRQLEGDMTGQIQIDLTDMLQGLYLLEIIDRDKVQSLKFIKGN